MLVDKAGSRHVGRQHALFNDLVRIIAWARYDFLDLALFIEDDRGLGSFEVDGTALHPGLAQHLVKGMQMLQGRHEFTVLFTQGLTFGTFRVKDCRHLVIGESCMGTEYRFIKAIAADRPALGDVHLANHRQSVGMGVERTKTVGEQLGQHRYHLPREIDRVTAPNRFLIERASRAHIVRDIGDGHDQLEAAGAGFPGAHGVIEILGVLAVNRHQGHITQVNAMQLVLLGHLSGHFSDLVMHFWRELGGDLVATDGNVDLHPRVHAFTKYLDHLTYRLHAGFRLLHNACRYDLSILGTTAGTGRNDHFLGNTRILGNQHAKLGGAGTIDTHDGLGIACQHLGDGRLITATPVTSADAHQHVVTMKDPAHLAGRQYQVGLLAIVTLHKAKTVTVPHYLALDQVELVDQGIGTGPVAQYLSVAFHGRQTPSHGFLQLLIHKPQQATHVFMSNRLAILFQARQQILTTGSRIIVIARLAAGMRVIAERPMSHAWGILGRGSSAVQ